MGLFPKNKLHIPHKDFLNESGFSKADDSYKAKMERENYLAIERWADEFGSSGSGASPYSITIAPSDSKSPLAPFADVIAPDTTTDMASFIQAFIDQTTFDWLSILWLDGQITCGELDCTGAAYWRVTGMATQITAAFGRDEAKTLFDFGNAEGVTIDGRFEIFSSGSGTATEDCIGLDVTDSTDVSISGVQTGWAGTSLLIGDTWGLAVSACEFYGMWGIRNDGSPDLNLALSSLHVEGDVHLKMDLCTMLGCSVAGKLSIPDAYDSTIVGNTITEQGSEVASGDVLVQLAGDSGTWTNSTFAHNILDHVAPGTGADVDLDAVLKFGGDGNGGTGRDCLIHANNITCANRDVTSSTCDAIHLAAEVDFCRVTDNTVRLRDLLGTGGTAGRAAVYLATGATGNIVEGNDLRDYSTTADPLLDGNWASAIDDNGTGTLTGWGNFT